jgi:hypothetical protein
MGMGAASSFLAPLFRLLNYLMDDQLHTARADPAVAFTMARRRPDFAEWVVEELNDLGWNEDYKELWDEVTKPILPEAEIVRWWLRDRDREDEMVDELTRRGWTDDRIDKMKELAQAIPGIADLISMAVRDAFNPAAIERFQYAQDFPEDVVPWAEKQGLSREWVERFWYSHWILPGVTQGFEMFHRLRPGTTETPFEIDDLKLLLRTADLAPYFRDRLIEIAYAPLTRVDVRRMYGTGTLDETGVYNAYRDLGYNDKNAMLLTDFTIKLETETERDLTRGVIVSGYKRGTIQYEEALTGLIDIGYTQENAELILAIADAELAQSRLDDELSRIEFLYVEGIIDQSGAYGELAPLQLPAEQQADLIAQWEVKRLKKISIPAKSEIFDLYGRDIIPLAEVKDLLKRRGYDNNSINWYVELLDQEISEEKTKELERAQKEQERIEKAEYATAYQRIKAGMDVEIAAIRLQIADIKLAMNYEEDPTALEAMVIQIVELKKEIADWNLAKSQIKYTYVGGEGEEEL